MEFDIVMIIYVELLNISTLNNKAIYFRPFHNEPG